MVSTSSNLDIYRSLHFHPLIIAIRGDLGSRDKRDQFQAKATRKHFITRRNIVRKVRDFSTHRHTDDAISVNRLVSELNMENPSPVLAYKPQGVEVDCD